MRCNGRRKKGEYEYLGGAEVFDHPSCDNVAPVIERAGGAFSPGHLQGRGAAPCTAHSPLCVMQEPFPAIEFITSTPSENLWKSCCDKDCLYFYRRSFSVAGSLRPQACVLAG